MNKDIVSIIIPLYYGRKYISKLIAQIEACSRYSSVFCFELIFSNDTPDDLIKNDFNSTYFHIKIINTDRNRGIQGARVRGFLKSTGKFVLFLDQDDKIAPEYFQSQISKIGTADAVVCNAVSGGRIKYNLDRPLYKTISRQCMVNEGNMILSPGQVLLRREAIPESWIKNIMQNNGADDWLLWLCMHSEGKQFACNQEVLFLREVHYHNASTNSRKMTLSEQEAVKIVEENHLLHSNERQILKDLLPKLHENRVKENEKWKQMFLILNDWFQICNCGKSISCYLKKQGIKRMAIYGYGYLGKTLLENLEAENVEVDYVIDKNAAFLNLDKKCRTLEDGLDPVDGIIISLIKSDLDLEKKIKEKIQTNVLWLEDIIISLQQE